MKLIKLFLLYVGLVCCSAGLFLLLSLFQVRDLLHMVEQRVQEDIIYENGKWNTAAYNADPLLPSTAPIYVLAADGYVIERWKPITGFLDASDFKHLLNFTNIQTVETTTDQDWRVLSTPIQSNNETIGVITLSYFHPTTENLNLIDEEIYRTVQKIQDQVRIEGDTFRVEPFDERKIPYYIAYQVVNKFNKIVFKSNNSNSIDRLPNFIDTSYIAAQLSNPPWQLIQDQRTQDIFLVKTQPLYVLGKGTPSQGVIVVGNNLTPLFALTLKYMLLLLILGGLGFVFYHISLQVNKSFAQLKKKKEKLTIHFDKQDSVLVINQTSIPIEYASNQYYLTDAVLTQQHKRWEVDEIMKKFGEELNERSWRKVYDATISINKKVTPLLGGKLILVEGKTFRLNPLFVTTK